MKQVNYEIQFTARRRVEFAETDMAGIVHFSNFYRYMEQTEHDYFRSLGLSIMERQPDGTIIGWPRVFSNCRFKAPAHYEDELECRLYVERIGVKSLTYRVDFWMDRTWVASGQIKTVCCVVRPGQPLESIPIPQRYLDVIHEAKVVSEQTT